MKLRPLTIGDKIAKVPIIQGGMGIGISLSSLAGAVAKNGGIGVISAAQPGYRHPDFTQYPLDANLVTLAEEIQKARTIADGGIVGVNIMCAANHYEKYVQCAVENQIDIIFSGAGLPMDLPRLVQGTSVKIVPIISPPKAAMTLLKFWDKRHGVTADAVVIEGPLAGGHLGFDEEGINRFTQEGYDSEVLEIIDIVKSFENKYQKKIPVIFGGGVFDRQDIDHYLELGCSGVQIGTRFVVTKECDADEEFKQAYIAGTKEDVIITKSPVGMLSRAINNFLLETTKDRRQPISRCYGCLKECNTNHIPYCITKALIDSVQGNVNEGLVFCGANVHRIKEMTTVEDLFKEWTQENM